MTAQAEVSTADAKDNIDKTIAAFLSRRMQADPRTFSDPVAETELAVPSGPDALSVDPPVMERRSLKRGPSREEYQPPSKPRRQLMSHNTVERDKVACANPTSDRHTSMQSSESESGSVCRENPVYPLEGHLTKHIAHTKVNVNTVPAASEEITTRLRASTGKVQPVPSALTGYFSTGNSSRISIAERSTSVGGL